MSFLADRTVAIRATAELLVVQRKRFAPMTFNLLPPASAYNLSFLNSSLWLMTEVSAPIGVLGQTPGQRSVTQGPPEADSILRLE